MKRNLLLLIITIFLFSLTYYLEEYLPNKKLLILRSKKVLIDFKSLGKPTSISFPHVHFQRENQNWKLQNNRDLREDLDELLNNFLSKFQIVRKLSLIEIEKIPKFNLQFSNKKSKERSFTLSFKNTDVQIFIGEKIKFSHNFYIKIRKGKKISYGIANYSLLITQPTRKELYHRSQFQYLKLLQWLKFKEDFYYNKMLFKKYDLKSISYLKTKNRKSFIFSFKNNIITPPLNHFVLSKKKIIHTKVLFTTAKAQNVFYLNTARNNKRVEKFKLKNKLSEIIVDKISYQLFQELGSLKGYFVYLKSTKIIYEISEEVSRIFLIKQKDFYKHNFEFEFQKMKELGFMINGKHFQLSLKKKSHHFLAYYLLLEGTDLRKKEVHLLNKTSSLFKMQINLGQLSFFNIKRRIFICRQNRSFCLAYKEDGRYTFPKRIE